MAARAENLMLPARKPVGGKAPPNPPFGVLSADARPPAFPASLGPAAVRDARHRRMLQVFTLTQFGAVQARSRCFDTKPSRPHSQALLTQPTPSSTVGSAPWSLDSLTVSIYPGYLAPPKTLI
jgi:hypothetical protein